MAMPSATTSHGASNTRSNASPSPLNAISVDSGTNLPSRFRTWCPSQRPRRAPHTITPMGMTLLVKATSRPHAAAAGSACVASHATVPDNTITITQGANTSLSTFAHNVSVVGVASVRRSTSFPVNS